MNQSNTSPDQTSYLPVPPPPLVYETRTLYIVATYSILFFVGLYGNTAVLTYVLFLTRSLKQSVLSLGNTFIYAVALCVVDSLVIISMPMTIMDIILGHWMFGTALCKVHWILESISKFLSTFVLTALAFDRYMGVCHPAQTSIRGPRATLFMLFMCAVVALGSLAPVFYSATARMRPLHAQPLAISQALMIRIERVKCVDNFDFKFRVAFSIYTFVLGFLIPATLISYFYTKLVCRVLRQHRVMERSSIPVKRVTAYTMAITFFYFFCWTPFWATQIYGLYDLLINWPQRPRQPSAAFIYFMYVIHALPYVNAAFNWIFYAQLNTQFRKGLWLVAEQYRRRGTTTENAVQHENHSSRSNYALCPTNQQRDHGNSNPFRTRVNTNEERDTMITRANQKPSVDESRV